MTLCDAKNVADIVARADGGCGTCVRVLVDRLNKVFPEFIFTQTEERVEDEDDMYDRVTVTER